MKQSVLVAFISLVFLTSGPLITMAATPAVDSLQQDVAALSRTLARMLSLSGQGGAIPPGYAVPTDMEMARILETGTMWLMRAQETDGNLRGHFRYEYAPYDDAYLDGDNIVRQTGAFFQLGEIERLDAANEYDLETSLVSAADYFESISKEATYDGYSFRCITEDEDSNLCKLGATSLALIGLLDLVEEYPVRGDRYESLIDDYASFILAMKKEDAGFRNAFTVGKTSARDTESPFSNGEALLALVRYVRFSDDNEEIRDVIDSAYSYLSADSQPFDTALYLWMMAALKDMNALWPNAEYRAYAQRFTDWRVGGFANRKNTQHNMCAYIEGVTSAYILLEDTLDSGRKTRWREDINIWLWKNSLLQVTKDDLRRVIWKDGVATIEELPNPERALGGFLTGYDVATERIDFTQHCLSAYAQTLKEIRGVPMRIK